MSTGEQEQRRCWTAVDHWGEEMLGRHKDAALHDALDAASQLARNHDLPPAEVSPLQGSFLAAQCQLVDAKNVLEIGTLGAHSTIWLASSSSDVRITSIEVDPKHKEIADQAIAGAGLNNRVEIKLGAAADILPLIREAVNGGKRSAFDFVFIYADKQNNLVYFNEALQMCCSRACIIVDNVDREGAVVNPEAAERDGRVRGTREVVEAAGKDERVLSATLIQTVGVKGYDGFMMAVVK